MQTGRLEKGDVQSVIEFLLRLISHIHFIILSCMRALVCCRKFIPISVVSTQCTFPKHAFVCSLYSHAHVLDLWMLFVHMCFDLSYFSLTSQ